MQLLRNDYQSVLSSTVQSLIDRLMIVGQTTFTVLIVTYSRQSIIDEVGRTGRHETVFAFASSRQFVPSINACALTRDFARVDSNWLDILSSGKACKSCRPSPVASAGLFFSTAHQSWPDKRSAHSLLCNVVSRYNLLRVCSSPKDEGSLLRLLLPQYKGLVIAREFSEISEVLPILQSVQCMYVELELKPDSSHDWLTVRGWKNILGTITV